MKIVDLFCGCGGLSLGFQNAGFEIVAAYDKWQAALSVYQKNFEHECKMLDLSNVEDCVAEIESKHPDMIIGGPPCQDFLPQAKGMKTMAGATSRSTMRKSSIGFVRNGLSWKTLNE